MKNTRVILRCLYSDKKEFWTQNELAYDLRWLLTKKQINMALWFLKKKGLVNVSYEKIRTAPYRLALYSLNLKKEIIISELVKNDNINYVSEKFLLATHSYYYGKEYYE